MNKTLKMSLATEDVRKEWVEFLKNNKDSLMYNNKPLATVSLRSTSSSQVRYFRLDVRWNTFINYLEEEARRFLVQVEKNGENIMELYRKIWSNFFYIAMRVISPEPVYHPQALENFRKLLKRTGDYYQIKNIITNLEEMIRKLGREMEKYPSVELYTVNLMTGAQRLHTLIDAINISAAYVVLRNILENLVKLFVYFAIGKSLGDPDIVVYGMFTYEYEAEKSDLKKLRRYSLKKFQREFVRKFQKLSPDVLSEEITLVDLLNKFKKRQMPLLGINVGVLSEFSQMYGLKDAKLDKLYSACSTIVHNQPPLPFFSLLEIKFFKLFLEKYADSFKKVIERLTGTTFRLKDVKISPLMNKEKLLKECLWVAEYLESVHDKELKEIIRNALIESQKQGKGLEGIWIKPLTLLSVFYILSPSSKQLRTFSFIEEDLENVVRLLQPLSFKIGIDYEVRSTLDVLREILLKELERYEEFSSLGLEQKEKVIFYLLSYYLPKIAEELLKET